jgi:hypothetical protein
MCVYVYAVDVRVREGRGWGRERAGGARDYTLMSGTKKFHLTAYMYERMRTVTNGSFTFQVG